MFFKSSRTLTTILAIYIDDIILTGNDQAEIREVKSFLDSEFRIKDLGEADYFLGMKILHEPRGIIITQRKFALDLLSEFDSLHSRTVSTPLDLNIKITIDSGDLLTDPIIYRRLLGKLNFLTHARPDLSFVVQTLSQYMHSPRSGHFQAALHTLRYVLNDPSLDFFFSSDPSFQILGFCDADWASYSDTRKSMSGFFLSLGNCPISWKL